MDENPHKATEEATGQHMAGESPVCLKDRIKLAAIGVLIIGIPAIVGFTPAKYAHLAATLGGLVCLLLALTGLWMLERKDRRPTSEQPPPNVPGKISKRAKLIS